MCDRSDCELICTLRNVNAGFYFLCVAGALRRMAYYHLEHTGELLTPQA